MIYLDNASTTKPCAAAIDAFVKTAESFGNPSSLHRLGLEAEKIIKSAKKTLSDIIGCKPDRIFFTSGGTESNNLAILGSAAKSRRRHIIISAVEHPSVLEPAASLEANGWKVDRVGVDGDGRVKLDELEELISAETALVSIMHVNNETGTVQPVEEIRQLINKKADGALFHIDAVQGFCKVPLSIKRADPDFMSISSHKINGFKGTGALYIKDIKTISPIFFGGGQQSSLRSGTENVGGIAAFAAAAAEHKDFNNTRVVELRRSLMKSVIDKIPAVKYNGAADGFSPYILNLSFKGIKSEILLHSLESEGIYVSTGSACSSHKPMPSHVLAAMGCTADEISGAVRFSFDSGIDETDITKTVDVLSEKVGEIRKYMR